MEVVPGQQNAFLTFKITNNGNDNQAYDLTFTDLTSDDFNSDNGTIYIFAPETDGSCDTANVGTAFTAALTADIASDQAICVVYEGDIPTTSTVDTGETVSDTNTSDVTLLAQTFSPTAYVNNTANPAPATQAEETGDSDNNVVTGLAENVLADDDDDGAGTDDAANNGDGFASSFYIVTSADPVSYTHLTLPTTPYV